jgi:hypothetical protein
MTLSTLLPLLAALAGGLFTFFLLRRRLGSDCLP